jgi:formylglycine-generating enzyme required for sulfatase activity
MMQPFIMIPPDELIPSRRNEPTLGPTVGTPWTVPDLSLEMLWCKPGAFHMGSSEDEEDRHDCETLHEVTLTSGYWLGKYPVTQAQWESVMGDNPSHFKGAGRPVETVSWTEASAFCEKLTAVESKAGRLPAGMAYQLPTEAEWEYACRAGTKTRFAFGDELTAKDANFDRNVGETTDVGKYPANPWGFHDTHGNVWEWCADWDGDYPTGAVSDPVGPAVDSDRIERGGSWFNSANLARSAIRISYEPANGSYILGFRLSLRSPASK